MNYKWPLNVIINNKKQPHPIDSITMAVYHPGRPRQRYLPSVLRQGKFVGGVGLTFPGVICNYGIFAITIKIKCPRWRQDAAAGFLSLPTGQFEWVPAFPDCHFTSKDTLRTRSEGFDSALQL